MIIRLDSIKNLGVFANVGGLGQHKFEKVTVIFGENIHGKSTLARIFTSLTNNDSQSIIDMRTLDTASMPEIKMNYLEHDSTTEKSVEFRGAWQTHTLENLIFVFDNDFINKNLINGSKIDRENKIGFTDFILGEEGVTLSKEIEGLKKSDNEIKPETKLPREINELDNIDQSRLLQFPYEELQTLDEEKSALEMDLISLNNATTITQLPEISNFTTIVSSSFESILNHMNELMARTFEGIDSNIISSFNEHLKQNTTNDATIEVWIKDGYTRHKSKEQCPFCGQNIEGLDLFDIYEKYFTIQYKTYTQEIAKDLDEQIDKLEFSLPNLDQELLRISQQILKYSDYLHDALDVTNIQIEDINLPKIFLQTKLDLTELIKQLKKMILVKNERPYESLKLESDLLVIPQSMQYLIESLYKAEIILAKFRDEVKKLKAKINVPSEELIANEKSIKQSLKTVKLRIFRNQFKKEIDEYKAGLKEKEVLKQTIDQKRRDMETSQNDYIETCFEQFNSIYKKLGNRDLSIKRITDNRGNRKVYFLKMLYKGHEIKEEDLPKILSESEKRSLSFALFYTKIMQLNEKHKLTIVLDDPVISYDDNRISSMVAIIDELQNTFGQIIILTHYTDFVKKLNSLTVRKSHFKLQRNAITASLVSHDIDTLLRTNLENAYHQIMVFINRESHSLPVQLLRVFFECYLNARYYDQIIKSGKINSGLKERIESLKEDLGEERFQKLDNHRDLLNPDHHTLNDETEENLRTYATTLIEDLYAMDNPTT